MMKPTDFHEKLFRVLMVLFCVGMISLSAITLLYVLSAKAHASQDAPDDLYAMQCVEGKCYYATGKQIPAATLAQFEKHLADEMAKIEQEEGATGDQ